MSVRVRLVLSSALMLILELALIRWSAANIVHLGYFSNVVLLGSFLGISLGFLRVRRTDRAPLYFPVALGLFAITVRTVPVTIDRNSSDLVFFTSVRLQGPPAWLVLPVVFAAVALIMAGPGELVGRCLGQLPRLEAYRLDLLGSLAGIAVFSGLAFLSTPSVVWGLVVAALTGVLLWPATTTRKPLPLLTVGGGLAALLAVLTLETLTPNVSWSPYNKIETVHATTPDGTPATTIFANGIGHPAFRPVGQRTQQDPLYEMPYRRIKQVPPRTRNVMIIGAGSGSDLALALQQQARSVHAVEIDPRIQKIGASQNPDHPYQDPRVHVTIGDGRAVLQNDHQRYDLIIFALPDSLTLVSGASQIRLESYLFTQQAIDAAYRRLTPDGALSMYNYYREPWLVGRLARTVQTSFGHAPCVDLTERARAVITAAVQQQDQRCVGEPVNLAAAPKPVDDDRPFLYVEHPGIPRFYLTVLGMIILLSLLAVRATAGPVRRMAPYGDLFMLGAAFLLLETRAVSGFALLFGTTWFVNALVFAGVIVAVLAAVETTRLLPRRPPLPVAYGALAVALAVAAFVPAEALLSLSTLPRAVVAIVVAFLPIFTANVVFAARFEQSADAATALGANLLGAIVGGSLEYLALIIGYHWLVAVAGLLYLAAFALGRSRGAGMVPVTPPAVCPRGGSGGGGAPPGGWGCVAAGRVAFATMRAAFMYGPGDVRVIDVPDPTIKEPTDVLVRVVRSCVCGSDLHPYHSMTPDPDGASMGHEFVGVVTDVGSDVATIRAGQLVIAPFAWSDGTCDFCRAGLQTSCRTGGFWNSKGTGGGQAEAVRVPLADGTLVPVDVPEDDALLPSLLSLSDVYGTGYHAALRGGVEAGRTVAVIGDGAVGLLAVLSAKQLGAERIVLMGRHAARTDLGREFGATDVVAERGEEGISAVKELTGGDGAHVVLEAVGHLRAYEQGLGVVRRGGTISRVGVPQYTDGPVGRILFGRNVTLTGGVAPARAYVETLMPGILAGEVQPGRVFDRELSLEETPDGYRAMDDREALKVMLRP